MRSIAIVLMILSISMAEVPGHNPPLDSNCGPGFQYTRDTASCHQADCPTGAGRTYTDDCSCGEAWGRPFTTCYDPNVPGLAIACVAAGSTCPNSSISVQCSSDYDCSHGDKCTGGYCGIVTYCNNDGDCPVNYACNTSSNLCITSTQCNSDSDCPDGYSCDISDYSCVPKQPTPQAGNQTQNAQNVSASFQCNSDSDCVAGYSCDTSQHQCKQGSSVINVILSSVMQFINAILSFFSQAAPPSSGMTNASLGECRYDSDCAPLCDGSVFWKQGCDAQSNSCVRTFETDCSQQTTVVGEYTFPMICSSGGCVDDNASIHAQKEALIAQANNYTMAMQEATQLRQVASKNCISALSDVTDSLIVNTALIYSVPSSVADLYSTTTQQMIEQINSASSSKMSAEEYISLNCNAMKSLDSDYALLSKQRDLVMQNASAFSGR